MGTKCFLLFYSRFVESTETARGRIKTVELDRSQTKWTAFDLEALIEEGHPARTSWKLSKELDFRRFEQDVKTTEGEAGRPCWEPRLLFSVWVYSYTRGVASARAINRMMSYEPGIRWLTADQPINYHTIADFRVGHEEALKEMFAQFLVVLETASLVNLDTLLVDGTKVRTVAGRASLHRRLTLEKRVKQARKVVRELDRKAADEGEAMEEKRRAAQRRAAREGLERAQAAMKKLKQLAGEARPGKVEELRVSTSEAEARNMKHADGGWGPSYNVQVTTEAQSRMIVGIGVTTAANDTQELIPALENVKATCGKLPQQVIADNGYATRSNVEWSSEQEVELIAPWKEDASREAGACVRNGIEKGFEPSAFRVQYGGQKLTCPAGNTLVVIGQERQHGVLRNVFEAKPAECRHCPWKKQCCGKSRAPRRITRVVESVAMKEHLARMKRPAVKALYGKRCEIAEFPHLWAKGVKKWRRFSVRGVVKAGMEALWVAFAYNVTQWIRIETTKPTAA
jgi:transposase